MAGGVALIGITLIPPPRYAVCSADSFRAAIAAPYIFTCKHFQPLRGKWIYYYKGSALQNEYSLLPERKAIFMQILTHLIFLLNLLKTLINHFS